MKIHILMKIIVEGYYNRYYTPMIDTGAEINICKFNCLPKEKWIKLKTPIVVKGFNNEGSLKFSLTFLYASKLDNKLLNNLNL